MQLKVLAGFKTRTSLRVMAFHDVVDNGFDSAHCGLQAEFEFLAASQEIAMHLICS